MIEQRRQPAHRRLLAVLPVPARRLARRIVYLARIVRALAVMPLGGLGVTSRVLPLMSGRFPRRCPLCGFNGRFTAFGTPLHFDVQCPKCESLERHRLFYLHCIERNELGKPETVLHFAPEAALRAVLASRVPSYITADAYQGKVDRKLDIEAIDLPPGSIDAVICNHVLEHVDDGAALHEIYRVLRPGGLLVCTVPIVEGWPASYENPAIADPAGRELHFGQHDHLRWYGRDFRDRLAAAGFGLRELTATGEETVEYGLKPGETLFLCRKPPAAD
ncbi:MAG: methyltransferase domain-containing protein [Sphingomonadales bacterium]